jgi:hypothetical protein
MRKALAVLLVSIAVTASAQEAELYDCLGEGSTACVDTAAIVFRDPCGQPYYVHRGKTSWPSLRNDGPITIAVNTYFFTWDTTYPLYVEIAPFAVPGECTTVAPGFTFIVARGLDQCGGIWDSIGPIDLTDYFIPLGGYYRLQVISFVHFWPRPPAPPRWTSPGLSCVRVTSHPVASPVAAIDWGNLKRLYR